MANERLWDAIGPLAFIANGGADGVVTVASVEGLRVKQQVIITSSTQPTLKDLEIKRVLSPTTLIVGPIKTTGEFLSRKNLSAYTTSDLAAIKVIEQKKSKPTAADIISAVYEQEPVVAIRTHSVDGLGNEYTNDNPNPVISNTWWNEADITRDGDDDIVKVEFLKDAALIETVDLEYNGEKSVVKVIKS